MKLFIPSCGDRIVLSSPWTFDLYYNEKRNRTFSKESGVKGEPITHNNVWTSDKKSTKFTLPENTILECDRVYIRTHAKTSTSKDDNYDSITWRIVGSKTKQRFWAKLSDCNNIEYHTNSVVPFENRKTEKKVKALTAEIIREKIHNSMFSLDDEEHIEFRSLFLDALNEDKVSKYFKTFHKRYTFAYEKNYKNSGRIYEKHPNVVDETKFFQLLRSHIHTTSCSFSKTKGVICQRVFLYRGSSLGLIDQYAHEYALQGIRVIVFSDENDQKVTSINIEFPKEET